MVLVVCSTCSLDKLGREVAAEMAVDGFVAPVLNPNTANVTQVEGVGGNGN